MIIDNKIKTFTEFKTYDDQDNYLALQDNHEVMEIAIQKFCK